MTTSVTLNPSSVHPPCTLNKRPEDLPWPSCHTSQTSQGLARWDASWGGVGRELGGGTRVEGWDACVGHLALAPTTFLRLSCSWLTMTRSPDSSLTMLPSSSQERSHTPGLCSAPWPTCPVTTVTGGLRCRVSVSSLMALASAEGKQRAAIRRRPWAQPGHAHCPKGRRVC